MKWPFFKGWFGRKKKRVVTHIRKSPWHIHKDKLLEMVTLRVHKILSLSVQPPEDVLSFTANLKAFVTYRVAKGIDTYLSDYCLLNEDSPDAILSMTTYAGMHKVTGSYIQETDQDTIDD